MNTLSCASPTGGEMQTDSCPVESLGPSSTGGSQITLGTPSDYHNFPCAATKVIKETIIDMTPRTSTRVVVPSQNKEVAWPYGSPRLNVVMYPQYLRLEDRIKSYKGWPTQHSQTVTEMAESGFFHSARLGEPDRVICYYCGLGLIDWLSGEDPDESHYNYSVGCTGKACTYVKTIIGRKKRKC